MYTIFDEFLSKVEEKAINFVREEFMKEYDAAKIEFVETLPEDMKAIINNLHSVDLLVNEATDALVKERKINIYDSISLGNNYITSPFYGFERRGFSEFITDKLFSKTEEVKEILSKHINLTHDVRGEYNKTIMKVKSLRSFKSKIKFLEELGFDVTWIKERIKEEPTCGIDKSKVFVCKENK
jgi:hypothetical protein